MAVARPLTLLLLLALPAFADDGREWRVFTTRDALGESWISWITEGPSGRIWVSHGDVATVSVLDGYSVALVRSPGLSLRVHEGFAGEAWASRFAESGEYVGLQRLEHDHWVPHPVDELRSASRAYEGALVPLGPGRVLFVSPEVVGELDTGTPDSVRVLRRAEGERLGAFLGLRRARGDTIWVMGRRGVARLDPARGGAWKEHLLPKGVFDLRALQEGAPGDLWGIASLRARPDGPEEGRAIVRLVSSDWVVVRREAGPSQLAGAWPDPDGGYWLLRTAGFHSSLSLVRDGTERVQPNSKVLSRGVADVLLEAGGAFWLGTALGLARVALVAWREPSGLPGREGHYSSLLEASAGTLYFLRDDVLLSQRRGRWQEHPLPRGHAATNVSQGLAELPDGRLVVQTAAPGILVFDPRKDRWNEIGHHPERSVGALGHAAGGGVWMTTSLSPTDSRLVRWDGGERFETILGQELMAPLGQPRCLMEASDGSIWLGSVSGGVARYREGRLQTFGPAEGYEGSGAFALLELEPGRIWVGDRNGIYAFDGRTWSVVRSDLETVRSMVRSADGSVWVASGSGLYRFRDGSWLDLSVSDGLPDAGIYEVYEDSTGHRWVGTTNGLRVHHPETDRDPPRTAQAGASDGIEVAPRGPVQFVFSGRDRWDVTPPGQLLFSHRVDDGAWSPFRPQPNALLRDLAPGLHRLDTRAMDRAGNVDSREARRAFRVLRPWYREPAVVLVGLLASLAIVLFAVSARQRYSTLERLVRERTADMRAASRGLQQSERRLRAVIDSIPHLVAWKDLEGFYQGANLSSARALGLSGPEQIVGRRDEDLLARPEDAIPLRQADRRVQQADVAELRVVQTVALAEGDRSLEISRIPLHDSGGPVTGVLVMAEDITERLEGLRERERLAAELEQAQRLEAVGKLAGGVAHDFNNLLTVIAGHATILKRRLGPEAPLARDVTVILAAADRAASLTRQLLAFSRRQVLQPRVLDLNDVVAGLEPMLARVIGEDVELVTVLHPGLHKVVADPTKLDQVLMNLVVNARDAMPRGGRLTIETANADLGESWVRSHPGLRAGAYAMLAVTDTGVGMTSEVLEQIFEPFFTTKAPGQGTGLGLATVYGIVKQSGGELWVGSEPGKGTTFKVYLPETSLVTEPAAPPASPVPAAPDDKGIILLVEDETAVRELVEEVLVDAGFTVLSAGHPEEALELSAAHQGEIDLMVTDVVMPGMSGPALAKRLVVERPTTRVLYVSGYAANTLGEQGVLEADVAFLEKPFTPEALLHKIRQVMAKEPERPETA